MAELDTQDIRDATQYEEDDRLFFLLVATPRKPPKTFHRKIIQPFLSERGWKKVSYRNTGFRALYFLHDQQRDRDRNDLFLSYQAKCRRCRFSNESNEATPSKRIKTEKETSEEIDGIGCSYCDEWTPLQRATADRNHLKEAISKYKQNNGGSFEVHVVLSKPVDDGDEFLRIASQPGATE